jgi:hypothetical protein
MTVEEAAQSLLAVRRETGCLSLMVSAFSSATERALFDRYTALATAAFAAHRPHVRQQACSTLVDLAVPSVAAKS